MTLRLNGVAPLPHLGVIRAEGEDAASFLHGQLTQDFLHLGTGEARLAALCSAKGRMLASFVGLRQDDGAILLVCSRDLLAGTLKRLSMFVLRAKVRLTDVTAELGVFGVCGDALQALSPGAHAPWTRQVLGGASLVVLYPALGQDRALWIAPTGTDAPAGAELDVAHWQWSEVMSGVATLQLATAEAFVPQMLNYESVGGVSFSKGCYPGQEVVARSQFRGTLKRRAYLVQSAQPLAAGQEVFHDSDPGQPCGLIAQAAAHPQAGWAGIASLQIAAVEAGGQLSAAAPDGPRLDVLALPYPLRTDL